MTLPDAPTAEELASFLRDTDQSELHVLSSWYAGMATWDPAELLDVAGAASENDSIRTIYVDIHQLDLGMIAGGISLIVQGLRHVRSVVIMTSGRCAPDVVDALLGIVREMKAQERWPVAELSLRTCSTPRAFADFAEGFPGLERLGVGGSCQCGNECPWAYAFMAEVASAIARVPTLRAVSFYAGGAIIPTRGCVEALSTASNAVNRLKIRVAEGSEAFLHRASSLCRNQNLKAVETVEVRGKSQSFPDVASFFGGDPGAGFAPCITDVQFFKCRLDGQLLDRAAGALQNADSVGFGRCRFPAMFEFLMRLPRLKYFFCIARGDSILRCESLRDEFHDEESMLDANASLLQLSRVLEQEECLLRYVELDVVCREAPPTLDVLDDKSFPAIARLMRHCKGTLVVSFGRLFSVSCPHIARGAADLHDDLTELSLRFYGCSFGNSDYSSILDALQSNQGLVKFELEFAPEAYTHAESDDNAEADDDAESDDGTESDSEWSAESNSDLDTRADEDFDLDMEFASDDELERPLPIAIRDLIEANSSLETLSIGGLDPITAADALERTLPVLSTTNRSLLVLELCKVDLFHRWSEIRGWLLSMLQTNGVFTELRGCVDPDDDDSEEGCRLRMLLTMNRYGRRFLLDPGSAPIGIWATILARASEDDEVQVMYAFLRANNENLIGRPRRGPTQGAPGQNVD